MVPGAIYWQTVRREPNIVSYWRLNDSAGSTQAIDYGARFGLNGFYNGSPTRGPSLIQGDPTAASYEFGTAGVNVDDVTIGDVSPLRITGDITIEAWIVSYSNSQTAAIVGKMNSGSSQPNPYYLGLVSGQITFKLGNGASAATLTGGTPQESIPSHVVVTSFRGATTIYLNGAVIATGSIGSQTVSDGSQTLVIGKVASGSLAFNGLIGEVAVYNGALSARRVSRHFAVGQNVFSDPAHYYGVDPPVYA